MNGTLVIKKLTTVASASSTVLKRIWDPLWKILSFSPADDAIYPSKNISASVEKGSLTVAFGSRFFSRVKMKGFREYNFEDGRYPQPEVVASSLALAINDLGASKAEVTLSIPKAWSVLKTVEFPLSVKENLSAVISYELDRLTPFASEDAFYDYRVVAESHEKLTILVMAAKADMINPYIEALRETGISVNKITVNLSGLETLCRHMDRNSAPIFVEIKENSYEGALFLNNSITGIFSGIFNTQDEKKKMDMLMTEVAPLADTLKIHEKPLQMLVLLRDKSATLKELLKLQMNLPVRILNETDLQLSSSVPYKEIPYAAAGAVLESLLPGSKGFNLLKKAIHDTPKTPKVVTILLILIILALWILYVLSPLRVETKRLSEIDRQIQIRKDEVLKVEALKKETESLNTEVETIQNFKANKPMALNILKELTTILPKTAWLSRVRITETTVELEGYATSATGLLSKLEASKYFKKTEFSSPTFRDARMNSDRFTIKMEIEGVQPDENKGAGNEDEE